MKQGNELVKGLVGVDLNLLVALDVLLRVASVTVAARELGVTQSAMSHTLRRLRNLTGDALLVRVGASLTATPRAESLRAPVHAALLAVRDALRHDPFDPATTTRTFRISAPDLFGLLVFPRLAALVRAAAPGADLALVPAGSTDALGSGTLDVAIVPVGLWTAPPDRPTEVLRRTVRDDGYSCFVRDGHPALVGGALSLEAYAAAPHLLVSPTGSGPGFVDEHLAGLSLHRRIAVRVPGFGEAAALLPSSDLILTAPDSLALLVEPGRVVGVPTPLPVPRQGIAMSWHRRMDGDAGNRWFRELVAAASSHPR